MAEQEFYSFDEALKQLRLKEEELKRLVSEGEIRAFREGETMKLRRSDVESLRSELSGGEVVDLGEVKEELVFEDDAALEEAGMATQEISDVETILDEPALEEGEIAIEEEVEVVETPEEAEEVRASAVGRTAPRPIESVAEVEGPSEAVLVRIALIATALLLLLAIPVCMSATGGKASGFAAAIASMFPGVNLSK